MKNGRNLRQLILFSLAAGCTLGGLGGGDVYANGYPPYEQILYINENNTVTQSDTDPNLKVDTSGLLKDGNFTYDTGDKLSKEKRGLIIMNSKKDLKSYTVDATLGAARNMHCNQVWAVFQPYTYSRTARWVDEFARSLSAADHVIISKIMGAREKNEWGVTSQDIGEKIPGSYCIDEFEEIADFVAQNAKPGDLVITMGGGDIYKCARMIRDRLAEKDVTEV